ncbi:hypothetical protein HDV00_009230 [Rhizophlyctis rosea]|nr:hypothetical protein HDV00_009230 [Rhizophlyctis rosea]
MYREPHIPYTKEEKEIKGSTITTKLMRGALSVLQQPIHYLRVHDLPATLKHESTVAAEFDKAAQLLLEFIVLEVIDEEKGSRTASLWFFNEAAARFAVLPAHNTCAQHQFRVTVEVLQSQEALDSHPAKMLLERTGTLRVPVVRVGPVPLPNNFKKPRYYDEVKRTHQYHEFSFKNKMDALRFYLRPIDWARGVKTWIFGNIVGEPTYQDADLFRKHVYPAELEVKTSSSSSSPDTTTNGNSNDDTSSPSALKSLLEQVRELRKLVGETATCTLISTESEGKLVSRAGKLRITPVVLFMAPSDGDALVVGSSVELCWLYESSVGGEASEKDMMDVVLMYAPDSNSDAIPVDGFSTRAPLKSETLTLTLPQKAEPNAHFTFRCQFGSISNTIYTSHFRITESTDTAALDETVLACVDVAQPADTPLRKTPKRDANADNNVPTNGDDTSAPLEISLKPKLNYPNPNTKTGALLTYDLSTSVDEEFEEGEISE